MQFKNYYTRKFAPITVMSLLLILTSCGSSQQVVQDSDGIYGTSGNEAGNIQVEQTTVVQENPNSTFYKNYFNEKASEYDYYTEDEVFTDIDDYEGDYAEENDSLQANYNAYAGWGQETNGVTVNVINTGWNAGWGWGYPGYGWGWNAWGWNAWGWNNWGYAGWGWGYPGWGMGAGWGYGYPAFGWGIPAIGPGSAYYWGEPYLYNGYGYASVNGRRGTPSYRNGYTRDSYNRYANTYGRSSGNMNISRTRTISEKGRTRTYSDGRPNNSSTIVKPKSGRTRTNTISNGRPNPNYNGNTSKPRTNTYSKPRSQSNSNTTPRSTAPSRSFSSPRPSSGGGGFSPSRGGGGSSRGGGRGGL